MWWTWPHLRRLWAGLGTVTAGLVVTYLYSLISEQALPHLRIVANLAQGYWPWFGAATLALIIVSVIAERAHRRHAVPRFIGEESRGKGAKPPPLPAATSTSNLIVGREDELHQLRAWYAKAANGDRRVVFVSGEAGIGKTTFVNTFIDSLRREGVRIARGQCVEQYGSGEPYMPMLEALTQLGQGPESQQLLAILHRLAPAWLAQLPALLTAEERARIQGETQGLTQQRMLREMAQTLAAIAADEPLVLLLEDLHWSDASTLDLIAAIARRTEPARLLILGTYRPVEMLAGDHPLRALKEDLEVHQQCQELRLKLLSEADVASYLAKRLGEGWAGEILRSADSAQNDLKGDRAGNETSLTQVPNLAESFRSERGNGRAEGGISAAPDSLAPLIYARTDGNALFMVNVVDYLVAQGPSLDASKIETPRNIRQMIERNLRRLDTDEQAVLEAASVAGAEFTAAVNRVRWAKTQGPTAQ